MPRAGKARAVFVDRDGVLNEEVDYLSRVEDLALIPGSAEAVRELRAAGFKVIVISNQSGVARGYFDQAALDKITAALEKEIAVDAIYYCVHLPDASCACRKPNPSQILKAAEKFDIDLKKSWFVGDSTVDVQTAINAGCIPLLVKTGKAGKDGHFPDAKPAQVFPDLKAAAAYILGART